MINLASETEPVRFVLNPDARITAFDTASRTPRSQLVVAERRFEINQTAVDLFTQLREPRALPDIETFLATGGFGTETSGDRAPGFAKALIRLGILVRTDGEGAEEDGVIAGTGLAAKRRPLTLRLPLASRRRILPLTSRLQLLFAPAALLWLWGFIIVVHAMFFAWTVHDAAMFLRAAGSQEYLLTTLLVLVSIFFHELGHLAACERYGAKHGEVGIGLFVIWPVAYANVTDCWSLSRYQRAMVDAGGVYFHLLFSGACCCLWFVKGDHLYGLLVHAILGCTVVNLNPFLKFDGYWLLTDLMGTPSLHRSTGEAWRYWLARAFKQGGVRKPEILQRHPVFVALFSFYAGGSLIFLAYLARILALYIPRVIAVVPEHLHRLAHLALQFDFGWPFWRLLLGTVIICVTVYRLGAFFLLRIFRGLRQAARLVRLSSQPSPIANDHQ